MNTKNSWVWLPRPYFHHHPQPPPLPSIKQQPNQSNQCNWVSSMANCPLTPPVYALAKLLFSVAVKAAAAFSDIALLGLFICCWQRRPLASTLAASPQQLIRKETGAFPCFFSPYHIAQLHLSFMRAPLSAPRKQWLHKLAQCQPCSFHCFILQIPSLTPMSGKQLYGSTRKWFCSTQQFSKAD